jgi:GcrA cell cycle regulator
MRGIWTRERIALLKRLWTDGETATAIAAQLHMSKSAVLGKVFRLRLPSAPKATAAAARRDAATVGRRRRGRLPTKPRIIPAAPVMASGKTLFELTNDSCRWPHRQPGTRTFYFCGAPGADLEGGRPYCERHMRRAYPAHKKAAANRAPAGAADRPIASPSIVPPGVKRQRLVFSLSRKRS